MKEMADARAEIHAGMVADEWLYRHGHIEEPRWLSEERESMRQSAAKILKDHVEAKEANAIIWSMLAVYAAGIWWFGKYAGWWS